MSNVQPGDLAYITKSPGQPHLVGHIVKVGRRYLGEPFYARDGRECVFSHYSDTEVAWYISYPHGQPIVIDLYRSTGGHLLGYLHYSELPFADEALRRIAGPSVDITEDETATA